jgi:3-hydroxyisobutyrate dehydrogenase
MSVRVAALGLGSMGSPMAARLLDKHEVTVFDPAPERVAELVDAGAESAPTPAEAVASSEIVLVAVRDRAQLEAALEGPDGALAGMREAATVVLTSTVGPDLVRELAQRLDERGFGLVDAPVSGGPARAAEGELLIMVGADPQQLERVRPVLERLAARIEHVGDQPGDGQALKAVNQLLCGVHIAAAAEALALARGLGLDAERALSALEQGAAASFMLSDRGRRMLEDDPPVRSRLDIFVKDMGIVLDVARRRGVPLPVAGAAEQLYALALKAGLGGEDDSTLVRMLDGSAAAR